LGTTTANTPRIYYLIGSRIYTEHSAIITALKVPRFLGNSGF
jgi:hypothetical protein